MRTIHIATILGLLAASACSAPPKEDAPSAATPTPATQPAAAPSAVPEPAEINTGNAEAAADALEKEIAADND